jgi:hypothetical protein
LTKLHIIAVRNIWGYCKYVKYLIFLIRRPQILPNVAWQRMEMAELSNRIPIFFIRLSDITTSISNAADENNSTRLLFWNRFALILVFFFDRTRFETNSYVIRSNETGLNKQSRDCEEKGYWVPEKKICSKSFSQLKTNIVNSSCLTCFLRKYFNRPSWLLNRCVFQSKNVKLIKCAHINIKYIGHAIKQLQSAGKLLQYFKNQSMCLIW